MGLEASGGDYRRSSRDDLEQPMTTRIARTSKQYLEVPLSSPNVADPTTLPVLFAFTSDLTPPTPSTAGNWTTRTVNGETVNIGRITVGGTGSGATVEIAGPYPAVRHAWVKVDGAAEDPVLRAGAVVIT
jgi:hypothetical protein